MSVSVYTQHQKLCKEYFNVKLLASEVRKHLNVCQQALDWGFGFDLDNDEYGPVLP